ncbi:MULTISPECIES: hypothetical protein [unclassified Psychrobacillus]|nr:hypothetical protein [Psychrobacillus sp. NEAU-3TGS]MDI2586066.1 hypothetical protein [Psychrobacillus sp. NEAU-3TGS]
MVFWILGAAILLSIVGFAFVYKLAMNDKSSTVDPKPKDAQ